MVFRINDIDITRYLAEDGLKWSWNGVDGPDAGRTMDALMHRCLVATKARVDVTCVWLTKADSVNLHRLIMPEYVNVVTDTCPWVSGQVSFRMYSNNGKATCSTEYSVGNQLFTDITFPLIQR